MVESFFYAQPVKIRFGEGSFDRLGELLDELGVKRAVLVCGRHFAPRALELTAQDGRFAAAFCSVEQNPQLSGVEETVRLCRRHGADAVIGVGGGSAMDTAKFAAAVAPASRRSSTRWTSSPWPSEAQRESTTYSLPGYFSSICCLARQADA